jgi:hypothetical protein
VTSPEISDVEIVGDSTADWMLGAPSNTAADVQSAYYWQARTAVSLTAQTGGAALLGRLIEASLPETCAIATPELAREDLLDPGTNSISRTYSIWEPFPESIGSRDAAWRMQRFVGVRPSSAPAPAMTGPARSSCLVIEDSALGFRAVESAWPRSISGSPPPANVILKMASPIATGPLWSSLIESVADRLTVCVPLGDLRKGELSVGQPLSWEQLSGELANAVRGHAELARAARVIVSIGHAGAALVSHAGTATLVFDPLSQEGEWERLHPGSPSGLGTCLAAALAVEAVHCESTPDWVAAISRGLAAARSVHIQGFLDKDAVDARLVFPVETAANLLRNPAGIDEAFSVAEIDASRGWSLRTGPAALDYGALARRIVIEGDAEACRGMPVERMGAWTSIDRTEIESVRSLRNIVRQYLAQPVRTRPLSVAVFGPPGSGKSFAVKQMSREWGASSLRVEVLEFNVSQFGSPADLAIAMHRVRDSAVQQMLPLVFWDEFDSQFEGREFGWLSRFLAPMQDGIFLENGAPRPIGPAIFVFAGGTHSSLAGFKERAGKLPAAKATDFLSRLRGHVDVLGPNASDESDQGYVLRRALLLRALLMAKSPHLSDGRQLNIDSGVLRAFLEAPAYLHGARSLEAIVDMSALHGRLRYERSSLPARHQMALHVDADAFLGLARGGTPAH